MGDANSTIELETKFSGDWDYTIRCEPGKIWINNDIETISMCWEDFDRIVAERDKFRRLTTALETEQAA